MKLAKVEASVELLFQMMQQGWSTQFIECTSGLPAGTKFLYSYVSDDTRAVTFVVAHDSFSDVEMGSEIPYLPHPVFRRYSFPDLEDQLRSLIASQPK